MGDHNVAHDGMHRTNLFYLGKCTNIIIGKGEERKKHWKTATEATGIAAHVVIAEVLAPVLLVIAVPLAAGRS